ncbi:ABC transporter ATP-binding protein [Mesoflavibacter sp. SCSIO 43206]|uniref:ABC transporter ATP-binding protein n=1 Tax=Mesoflavibacter sp. SCSIO 43206 TaxID=2779362 RepID=UPI001CA9F3A2|nr:ABC transporter ATP-binding protein [Mesoflavibacter sp. SCSIO 43206]UAB74703.1 ABC transporter ATP-binding protein [Mesoflavibacter sp. SCSIO 43206]
MNPEQNIQTDKEVLVKVEGLSKKFCKDLKTSLWYGVKDLMTGIGGSTNERMLRPKEFWAVKDINFELRRGECLGLIGHNGAGKSTLLKILNGLINPDAGKVTIKGRVGALIELGAGFNPILSGRENIYNNGAILGFTRQEIDQKLDAIIAFAELEEFIDMPVQHYSSGMKVRLGFAVASQLEPDVLIIDEVLAVGDLGFVLKCFKTIDHILPNTAVIFVSHNMPMVSRICTHIILMDKGMSKFNGSDISSAIDLYYTRFANNESNIVYDDNSIALEAITMPNTKQFDGIYQLSWNNDLNLSVRVKLREEEIPIFKFTVFDKELRPVALLEPNCKINNLEIIDTILSFNVSHKNIQLSKGVYSLNLSIESKKGSPLLRINNIMAFQINHEMNVWQPFLLQSEYSNNKVKL